MYRNVTLEVTFARIDASFSHYIGNDLAIIVQISDLNGSPFDLTGYTVDWIFKSQSSTAIIIRKRTGDATLTILDQTTNVGRVSFNINAADTNGLLAGAYYHEMLIIDQSSKKTTVMSGIVTLTSVVLPTA